MRNMTLKKFIAPIIALTIVGGLLWYDLRPNRLISKDKPVFKDSDAISLNGEPAWIYEGYASQLEKYVKFMDEERNGTLDIVSYIESGAKHTLFIGSDKHKWRKMWSQITKYEKSVKERGSKLPEKDLSSNFWK